MNEEELRKIFLWPKAHEIESITRDIYNKPDPLVSCVENLVLEKKAYRPTQGATRRTEQQQKLRRWISEQKDHEEIIRQNLRIGYRSTINENDFPIKEGETKRTISVSPNILYMLDKTSDFINCYKESFQNRKLKFGP